MVPPQSPVPSPDDSAAAKTAWRDQLLTARKRRPLAQVHDAGVAIAQHLLASDDVRRAATVAAYVSVGPEPGTGALLDGLLALGKRVLLPVTLRDLDLDWAPYTGPDSLVRAGFGLLEPVAPRLGVDAIATPDLIVVPALAVSWSGYRLGRGGGCYDRALARVPVGTPTVVPLYDDELGRPVPTERHDRPVTAALTPGGGITRLPAST